MEDFGLKIVVEGLCIENRQSRFEDFIMPHQHLIHKFLVMICRELCYFQDILEL